jgi:Skp family chaperone for outer membrane proteins
MNRCHILAAGLIAALGMVFVSGAAGPPEGEKKAQPAQPAIVLGQKTAYFNMAAAMRDFHLAKYKVWLLNKKKTDLSQDLIAWRADYLKLQLELRGRPDHPQKDEKAQQMLALARKIEDADRKISKQLNEDAGATIADVYDKMKAVVDKAAELNGYRVVIAYPDAVTSEEKNSPQIKELKLKPPAAQPFYVSPDVDLTAVVVKALNAWYPPVDPETGKVVDVSKLELPVPSAAPPLPMPPPPRTPLIPIPVPNR